MESEPAATAPQAFTRKASGLIRQASAWDVFNFDVINGIPGIIVIFMLLYIPGLYPGASIPLATLITGILAIPLVLVYARMATVFPRSGGDYVYNSRLLHPSVGFGINVTIVVAVLFLIGQGGVYTGGYGIGPLLRVTGIYWHNQGLIDAGNWVSSSGWGLFIVGAAALVGFILLFVFAGMKVYFKVQTSLMVVGTIALLIAIAYGLFLSKGTALNNIDHALKGAGSKGIAHFAVGTPVPFSLKQTLMCVLWPMFGLLAALYSCFIGGEVKQPAKSQQRGMLGALAFMSAELILVSAVFLHQFGYVFWANLGLANPSTYGISSTPTFIELSALSMHNGIIAVITLLLFSIWGIALVGVNTAVAARCMFAWSIDRIVPKWVSAVSTRWSSPYAALLLAMGLGIFWAALFSAKLLTPLGSLWGFNLAYTAVFISAILLPFRMRALWKSSPCNGVLAGIPTIAIWGVAALVAQGFFDYVTATDQIAGVTPASGFIKFSAFFMIALAATAFYFVVRAVRRRQGLDIDLNFKEVPPE
jgi:amino acid transporter